MAYFGVNITFTSQFRIRFEITFIIYYSLDMCFDVLKNHMPDYRRAASPPQY